MRLISQVFFLCFFILPSFSCEALIDIQKVKIRPLKLEECLLPNDHPLQETLQGLFSTPYLFQSNDHLRRAGFRPCNKPRKPLMVASHPDLPDHLIKKYMNKVSRERQIRGYLNRISAARALREFIELNDLQYITVPQKWLYKLPKRFSDRLTGQSSYVLIVEKVDMYSGGDDPQGEVAKRYSRVDFDTLKELCIVLCCYRGLDSSLRNMPFTHQNQIAFIDTEHWRDEDRDFLRHVKCHLTPEHQEYAFALFEEFKKQDQK